MIVSLMAALATVLSFPPIMGQLPDTQLRVHRESNILFSVTNFGFIGSQDGGFPDEEGIFAVPPGAEFPAYSGKEYLFQGAIWVGAVIDTVNNMGQPILDTLVSIGNDGWWGQLFELYPPPSGIQSMWRDRIIADEEIFAFYSDTCTTPSLVNPDPNDGRPHIPLGITVHQHSKCWSSTGYNEFFIIDFLIENIGDRQLHDAWIGLYYDGDVYDSTENPYTPEQGAQDDLCGFIERGSNRGIAWLADNNGQPYDGQFDYRSVTGVMGMVLLYPLDGIQTNFNWWISNINHQYDWGPRRFENGTNPFPGGGMGTPGGDKAKYKVMSNGEHDYDQARCALYHAGWIDPPPNAADMANGYDTRFLISFGPFQLAAGAIETVTVALVGGRNLHTDPQNYSDHLLGHEFDSSQIALYYQGLDFSDLIAKADSVYSYYQNNYVQVPVSPPTDFHVVEWDQNHVDLAWRPSWYSQLREYRIYRGISPGQYDPQPITPANLLDTTFTDNNVQNNTTYYYVITTVRTTGAESSHSSEVRANSGQPQTPTGLTATRGNRLVDLGWAPNPDDDIEGYIIHRGFHGESLSVIDSTDLLTFTDYGVVNGIAYDYSISAYDIYGNESFNSAIAGAIPIGQDSGVVLINANRTGSYNPDYDSMVVFYQTALSGFRHSIMNRAPSSLQDLANFSAAIWCRETSLGRFSMLDAPVIAVLTSYLDNGGKLIIEGTRNIVHPPNMQGLVQFDEADFQNRYLNLAGAEFPNVLSNTEFIGAEPHVMEFPIADVDTARANRIIYPPGENYGRLFGIGALIPNDTGEVIYNYIAVNPDTSSLSGRPVGIIHQDTNFTTATLEMPLYYIREPNSITILCNILDDFGVPVVEENEPIIPDVLSLLQNYPNPFNAQTTISFTLPQTGEVRLDIYNILGERVATLCQGALPAGWHKIIWDAEGLSSGIYLARLETDKGADKIKMVILK